MKNISNDSAFGFVDNRSSDYADNEVHYGLTKREYFAAAALTGLCASGMYTNKEIHRQIGGDTLAGKAVALSALDIADNLIEELEK